MAPGDERDSRTDAELLQAHIEGDGEAFGELFARHRDRLWAVALRTMGNPEDAADALQDAMIAAWRRADSFRGASAVTTWLHRVVVNACLDRHRALKSRHAVPLPDDLEAVAVRGAVVANPAPDDPSDLVVADERRRVLLAALAELPAEQRDALVLVDMQGHSVAEAAAALAVAVGTVKSRCSRGRAKLAHLLGPILGPAAEGNRDTDDSVSLEPDRLPPPRSLGPQGGAR